MAERFVYLPLVGLAGAFVVVAATACRRWRESLPQPRRRSAQLVCGASLLLVVAALAGRTITRNADWSSAARLYATSLAAAPQSVKLIGWTAYATFGARSSWRSRESRSWSDRRCRSSTGRRRSTATSVATP
jgi:hypothetical protein